MNSKTKSLPVSTILGAGLVMALLWAYWPVLTNLLEQLLESEDYSFGLLLPLVSGYLVYLKWPEIRRGPWWPSWMGIVVLALGFFLYIVGEASTDLYTTRVSFIVSLSGVMLLFGGWHLLRLLWFPLLLLLLMIPLPGFLMRQVTLPLQLLSSHLATDILQIIGVPAVRQGNVIDLGVRQLQVVAACSGLRYILSLLALGIVFCYFYQRRPWKVALLLISIIPAAIIANALRVAGMGIFPALQEGFWHSFSGWLIFIFCFGFLSVFNWVLNFRQPEAKTAAIKETSPEAAAQRGGRPSYSSYLAVALMIMVVSGYFARVVGRVSPVPLLQSFDNFPLQLGPWQGKRSYIDAEMFQATGASQYLNVDFHNPSQGSVSLWIAYYENQKGGGSVHSPFTCLTGSGWSLIETGITDVVSGLPVQYLVMEQGGVRYLVYYWYLQRGRWLTSEYLNKFYLSYDGLLSRRADGALIRLITPVDKNVELTKNRLTTFADLLIPILPKFIRY